MQKTENRKGLKILKTNEVLEAKNIVEMYYAQ